MGGEINSGYTKEIKSMVIGQIKNKTRGDFQVFDLASWVSV